MMKPRTKERADTLNVRRRDLRRDVAAAVLLVVAVPLVVVVGGDGLLINHSTLGQNALKSATKSIVWMSMPVQ